MSHVGGGREMAAAEMVMAVRAVSEGVDGDISATKPAFNVCGNVVTSRGVVRRRLGDGCSATVKPACRRGVATDEVT